MLLLRLIDVLRCAAAQLSMQLINLPEMTLSCLVELEVETSACDTSSLSAGGLASEAAAGC